MNGWEQNDRAAAIAQSWVNGGAKQERERIIALLETRLDDCYEKNDMGGWSFMPDLFIALIKGEN